MNVYRSPPNGQLAIIKDLMDRLRDRRATDDNMRPTLVTEMLRLLHLYLSESFLEQFIQRDIDSQLVSIILSFTSYSASLISELRHCLELAYLLLSYEGERRNIGNSTDLSNFIGFGRVASELGLNVLDKLLKFPVVSLKDIVNGILQFPDALYDFLRKAKQDLRTSIKDKFPKLLLQIEWDRFGKLKVYLLQLLLNEYKYDINSFPASFRQLPLVIILSNLERTSAHDQLLDYVLNCEAINLEIDCYGGFTTPLDYAIHHNNFDVAVKLIKAGAKLSNVKTRKIYVRSPQFTNLVKTITLKGLNHLDFLDFQIFQHDGADSRMSYELDSLKIWLTSVPKRRGTLMELATIKLREELASAQLMQKIGNREVDPIVKFFAQEI